VPVVVPVGASVVGAVMSVSVPTQSLLSPHSGVVQAGARRERVRGSA
jgi:hypothetical protein